MTPSERAEWKRCRAAWADVLIDAALALGTERTLQLLLAPLRDAAGAGGGVGAGGAAALPDWQTAELALHCLRSVRTVVATAPGEPQLEAVLGALPDLLAAAAASASGGAAAAAAAGSGGAAGGSGGAAGGAGGGGGGGAAGVGQLRYTAALVVAGYSDWLGRSLASGRCQGLLQRCVCFGFEVGDRGGCLGFVGL